MTGVDLGLEDLVVTSTGEKVENPRFLNVRRPACGGNRNRCQGKGGFRRTAARRRALVAKAHERTANARKDFQHKLSRRLVTRAKRSASRP